MVNEYETVASVPAGSAMTTVQLAGPAAASPAATATVSPDGPLR